MRILLSNKFYYRRGGDCIYMLNLEQLLKKYGHEVAVFAMDYPENIDSEWFPYFPSEMTKMKALSRPFGDEEVKRKFTQILVDFKPDVAHFNNIHTQLSPAIVEIAKQKGVRTVWTIHDYKLLCPRYDCIRNGQSCEVCFSGVKRFCFMNKCMKDSRIASLIGMLEAQKWNRKRLEKCTDVFLCPSTFMAEEMLHGGFNKSKIKTLYNFIDTDKCFRNSYEKSDYFCYIGRLSHEKGVKTLIKAVRDFPYKLKIIGGGPMENELKTLASPNVEFLGVKGWNDIKELVGRAKFIVVPSEWYENNPLSVIESLCLGTPVLGAWIGGIPELIEEQVDGLTFISGDVADLKEKIGEMLKSSFDYQQIAYKSQKKFSSDVYYESLMKLYIEA